LVCLAVALATERKDELVAHYGEGFDRQVIANAAGIPIRGDASDIGEVLREGESGQGKTVTSVLAARLPNLEQQLKAAKFNAIKAVLARTDSGNEKPAEAKAEGHGSQELRSEDEQIDFKELAAKLKARIRGQNEAIEVLTRRLSVKMAGLDLDPERPNGVFMFVGPTGVGKTELARALADELYDDDGALIRLDMSEYSEPWTASRLTGPEQGYVGSQNPAGWLTSRVARRPRSVLLLDEIEKADPEIWNKFLQVFDTGSLTDSRGRAADFSETVVIMTSNLGSGVFTENPVGFSSGAQDAAERHRREETELVEAVRKALPPELMNRIDAVVPFEALSLEAIRQICDVEIDGLIARLAGRDLQLVVPDDVRNLLATANADRRYGARHLQRNIETLLLEPLALEGPKTGTATAVLNDGAVTFGVGAGNARDGKGQVGS
jgi:ATP-dependent Clp protease ATP-binding subunit ClpA